MSSNSFECGQAIPRAIGGWFSVMARARVGNPGNASVRTYQPESPVGIQ